MLISRKQRKVKDEAKKREKEAEDTEKEDI